MGLICGPVSRHTARSQLLAVHGNLLQSLPSSLGQLGCLRSLNLSGNQLHSLPDVWAGLTSLEELALSGNLCTTVWGPWVGTLPLFPLYFLC